MHANLRKILLAATMLCAAPPAFANVITDWDEKAVATVQTRMAPPAAYRVMAIVHLAMFDAVNSIEPHYKPYKTSIAAPPSACGFKTASTSTRSASGWAAPPTRPGRRASGRQTMLLYRMAQRPRHEHRRGKGWSCSYTCWRSIVPL